MIKGNGTHPKSFENRFFFNMIRRYKKKVNVSSKILYVDKKETAKLMNLII